MKKIKWEKAGDKQWIAAAWYWYARCVLTSIYKINGKWTLDDKPYDRLKDAKAATESHILAELRKMRDEISEYIGCDQQTAALKMGFSLDCGVHDCCTRTDNPKHDYCIAHREILKALEDK